VDRLEKKIKSLPVSPGVYQYLDEHGRLLYVGKAKNLKNRVRSYFSFLPSLTPDPRLGARIHKMISETHDLSYIIVDTESDALILENSLIKQLKPKYNILLRDDKTYPYIYIDLSLPFPRFEITRKVIGGKKIRYFGPFASGARDILNSIYELVKMVQKKSCLKEKKVCIFYQIGRCAAPCENMIDRETYMTMIDEAISLINHKEKMCARLLTKMKEYAEREHYEEAARLRDRIKNIEASSIQSSVDLARNENFDVIAIGALGSSAAAVRLFIREGKVISSSRQNISSYQGVEESEALRQAIVSFYSVDMPITATTIYVMSEFDDMSGVTALLNDRFNRKFEIICPKIGAKKAIVDLARMNAVEILHKSDSDILEAVKELCNLENPPRRIEAFDNSHMMGEAPAGAMIVYDAEIFIKSDYRHYNLTSSNEYYQMKEMLSRRVESFNENPPPDLWIIDGGETLRKLAQDILNSVGVTIGIVAISKEKLDAKAHRAKGAARDTLYIENEALRLDPNDKRLHFFQKLRDEAHRFAIAFHRKQKRKADMRFELLKKKGVGAAAVKRLISFFGTFEAIERASFDEIRAAAGSKTAAALKGEGESR
jgi:excinuclease ABC subunit C